MGLLVLGFVLSSVAGIAVGKLALRLLNRRGANSIRLAAAILLGIAVTMTIIAPVTQWLVKSTTTTLIAMDPSEGEQRLESFGIPPGTTSDFCYRFSLVGVTILADFKMAEQDFLAWMKSQGWQVKKIVSESEYWNEANASDAALPYEAIVYPVRNYDAEREFQVQRGYKYFDYQRDNPDNTTTLVYDLESGRVYLTHTTY